MAASNITCDTRDLDIAATMDELTIRLDELNGMLATFAECAKANEMQGDWGAQALHGAARLARDSGQLVQRVHQAVMPLISRQ